MARYKFLKPCKIDGKWASVGDIADLSDKDVIKHLKNHQAIEETAEARSLTPEEELQKVNGVSAKIAKILVEAGINTVDKLSAYEVKQLVEIEGINEKTATKIYKAFE